MEDQLVNFETAKVAKEKGFKIKCDYGFNLQGLESYDTSIDRANGLLIDRPTQSLLQKWLREIHNIDVFAMSVRFTGYEEIGYYTYCIKGIYPIKNYRLNSYEEALDIGLFEELKLIN